MATLALPRPVSQRTYLWLHLLLVIGSVVMLTPFAFMLVVSLWPKNAFMARSFPLNQFTIQNYFEVFRQTPFGRYYLNSIIVSVSIVLLQIFTSSLAAFAFARLRFRGASHSFCSILPR